MRLLRGWKWGVYGCVVEAGWDLEEHGWDPRSGWRGGGVGPYGIDREPVNGGALRDRGNTELS